MLDTGALFEAKPSTGRLAFSAIARLMIARVDWAAFMREVGMDIPHIKDGIGIMGKGCVSRQVVLSHCDLEKANDLSDGKVGSCMLVLLLSLVLVAHGRAQLVKPLARGPLCDSSPCHSGTPLRDSSCEVWKRKCRRDSASTTRCATWLATSSQCHGCVEDHSETWFGPRRSCRVAWLIFRHDLGGQG